MLDRTRQGRLVTRHTARGFPFEIWEEPMPRIRNEFLDCSLYLYRSKHEALEGINIGGSGFYVSIDGERLPPPGGFVYAVTNKHVIEAGATCIRFNTKDGKTDVAEFKESDWTLADDDDLAVIPLPAKLGQISAMKSIGLEQFLTAKESQDFDVGPGDEVILIGRFVNQEGKERNIPTVRFGFVSQRASEPIEYDGRLQDSFLCEIKSIGGFSGSPVFLTPNWRLPREAKAPDELDKGFLLGVDWAHIQNWECATDVHGVELPNILYPVNTGMMAVVPAWKLEALLKIPKLADRRREVEDAIIAHRSAPKVAVDSAAPAVVDLPTKDAAHDHREGFNSLVNAAAQKRPQGG